MRYNEGRLWEKIGKYAQHLGREAVERALRLYHAAQRPETPAWAKTVAYGAIVYLVNPVDVIPDIPPVGFTDDVAVLAAAVVTLALYIDDAVVAAARATADRWFS